MLQSEVAEVMKALVWAIKENYTSHRIIITCRYDFEFSQLQYFHKQPLDALQGADLQKKFNRLTAFSAKSQVDEGLKSQAQKLADGNPRLLEWLDKLLVAPHPLTPSPQARRGDRITHEEKRGDDESVDVAAILNRLAADPVELREQVLAEALLEQMDTIMREMLSRGLVFELPVPREALAAVCDTIPNLSHYISRAVALGLLEVSHDQALRVPRILPVQLGDGEVLYKQAAEVLYRLWWEDAKTSIEEQKLEIHRLALLGKEEKKAADIASSLVHRWRQKSRFREAVQLCKSTLEITEDYRILKEMAYCKSQVGEVAQALKHYQQALNLCPSEDKQEQASISHCLGILKANRGEIEEAIALYQQSLALKEQIGDVQDKAATLHNLGHLKANKGEIEEAIALYEKSFAINEQIGNVQGKAATLHCLGGLKANKGEIEEAIALFQQSLAIEEQIGDVQGKAMTLWWLGGMAEQQGDYNKALDYLQPALEILQRIQSPYAESVGQVVARVQDLIRNS